MTTAELLEALDAIAAPAGAGIDSQLRRLRDIDTALRAFGEANEELLSERTRIFVALRSLSPPVLYTVLAEAAGVTDGRVMQTTRKAADDAAGA